MKSICALVFFCAICTLAGSTDGFAVTFGPKLFLTENGIALSSFPSKQVLSRKIQVRRATPGHSIGWTAVSNQPWLTVTAGGVTEGSLQVTADPTGLKPDIYHEAVVTVSTNGGDFVDSEVLWVGLWVGSSDPQTVNTNRIATGMVANPVEPILYVIDGGSSIYEYNVYSGQVVATLQNVAPSVGALEISSNGRILFAFDSTNSKIIALKLRDDTQIGSYPIDSPFYFNMVYARPFGQQALFVSGGPVIAIPSGEKLADNPLSNFIAVPPNGQKLFGVDTGVSPGTLYSYSVGLDAGKLVIKFVKSAFEFDLGNCQDLAVSRNGKLVYPACGAPYEFDAFDGDTLSLVRTLSAQPYPNNIEVDTKGDVVGGIDGIDQPNDVFVFSAVGFSKGKVHAGNEQQAVLMKVSGDTTRVISETGTQTLSFRNMH